MVRLKWECTDTPTIFKHGYSINYGAVDANGRRNCQCNTIIFVKLKKASERAMAKAEVNVRKINIFGAFSQGSSNSSPPSVLQEEASQALRTLSSEGTATRDPVSLPLED